jgi:hypothetical protein
MLRRLFSIASVLTTILCVAVVVLWVRSCVASDGITFDLGEHSFNVSTANLAVFTNWESRPRHLRSWRHDPAYNGQTFSDFFIPQHEVQTGIFGSPHYYSWLGFTLTPTYYSDGYWSTIVGLPYYALFVVTALLPLVKGRWWYKRRSRKLRSLYLTCGYDLRTTPDRCPECGTPVQPHPVPSGDS